MLAQAPFQFLPRSYKAQEMESNIKLQGEIEKLRAMRELLTDNQDAGVESRLLNSSAELFKILEEVDKNSEAELENLADTSIFDRLKKTSLALNQEAEGHILNKYDIKGISLDNLEQLYNSMYTGLGNMQSTRTHLIKRGMSP